MEKTLQRATRRHGTCLRGPHIYGIEIVRRFFKLWESCDLKRTGMHQICIHSLLEYNHPTWFKVPFTVRANTPVEQNRSHKTANQPHIFWTFIHWGLCERCLRGVSLGLLSKQPTPADDALVRQLKVPQILLCSSRCWGGTVLVLCGMTEYYQTCFCFVIFGGQEGQEHVWHQQDPGHLGQPLLWSHHPQVREPGYDIDQKFQTDMNRKSLVERGKHHEDGLNIYIYICTLYICIWAYIYTQIYILIKIQIHIQRPLSDLSGVISSPAAKFSVARSGDIWDPSRWTSLKRWCVSWLHLA